MMNTFESDVKLEMIDGHDNVPVAGTMNVPQAASRNFGDPNFNTLDEPIQETISRDLRAVWSKFKHVMYPVEKRSLLTDWDLWGPLLLCTFMAMILQGDENMHDFHDGGPEFAEVFVIVWVGSLIVTLNSKLLGGNISFFQSVCVLGYCLLPCAIALAFVRVVLFAKQNVLTFLMRFLACLAGLIWSVYASWCFLGDSQPEDRKGLAVYPVFLFYFIISWLILSLTA